MNNSDYIVFWFSIFRFRFHTNQHSSNSSLCRWEPPFKTPLLTNSSASLLKVTGMATAWLVQSLDAQILLKPQVGVSYHHVYTCMTWGNFGDAHWNLKQLYMPSGMINFLNRYLAAHNFDIHLNEMAKGKNICTTFGWIYDIHTCMKLQKERHSLWLFPVTLDIGKWGLFPCKTSLQKDEKV